MIISALTFLFMIFPAPFAIFLLALITLSLIVTVFKVIALVLDSIPFL